MDYPETEPSTIFPKLNMENINPVIVSTCLVGDKTNILCFTVQRIHNFPKYADLAEHFMVSIQAEE